MPRINTCYGKSILELTFPLYKNIENFHKIISYLRKKPLKNKLNKMEWINENV